MVPFQLVLLTCKAKIAVGVVYQRNCYLASTLQNYLWFKSAEELRLYFEQEQTADKVMFPGDKQLWNWLAP